MPDALSQQPGASRVALWVPVLGYMALIFALSSIRETPPLPEGMDKDLHALLYAGLGLLLARARARGRRGVTWSTVAQATLIAGLYGVSDEAHQYFNPPRAVEALDVAADTIGAALGASALRAWDIIRSRNGV